ncbi:MAG: chloride channel protein, partial [Dehalococcoidia bacterium]
IDFSMEHLLGRLAGFTPPGPRGEGETVFEAPLRPWALPLVAALGGLLSGVIVFTLAPEAEGHGTDAAIDAFHERGGRIRSRIPAIKLVASAITIGSGGSAGREGPTAQIAAGFGSWLGDVFRLSPADRRIAMAVGVGAGIGAIFKAPLGGALLSAEILYLRDFELEAIVPGFIASVVGYTIFAAWSGWQPVFGTDLGFRFDDPQSLIWYAALGIVAGFVGIAYVRTFYGMRDLFHRLNVPPHVKPAIGGLLVGIIAIWFPQVLSMGYGWLQFAIEGDTVRLPVMTMLLLVALKILATSLTISSGGSGGVFAPGLFIGGMLGGAMWGLLHNHVPGLPAEPEPFVVVGMGAMFGGVAKAPIAIMLMVAEMTGEFTMIVPAMIAISVSYLITGNISIYENQVATRADSPAHRGEYTIPLIQAVTVAQAMHSAPVTVRPATSIDEAQAIMRAQDLSGVPVTDDDRLVGIFLMVDALSAQLDGSSHVADAMRRDVVVTYPTDTLHTALQRMTRSAILGLPVVDRQEPDRLVGMLTIQDLSRILDLQVNELATNPETVRSAADDPLRRVSVVETMSVQFERALPTDRVGEVAERLAASGQYSVVVASPEAGLCGIATIPDFERATSGDGGDQTMADIMTRRVITARPTQSVADAIAQPGAEVARQLPVVREQDGRLVPVGLLSRADVVIAYMRGRERLTGGENGRGRPRAVSEGVYSLDFLVEQGDHVNSRTLAELRLPREAVVTAVERDGATLVPRGQLRRLTGDRVHIMGNEDALDEVRRLFE